MLKFDFFSNGFNVIILKVNYLFSDNIGSQYDLHAFWLVVIFIFLEHQENSFFDSLNLWLVGNAIWFYHLNDSLSLCASWFSAFSYFQFLSILCAELWMSLRCMASNAREFLKSPAATWELAVEQLWYLWCCTTFLIIVVVWRIIWLSCCCILFFSCSFILWLSYCFSILLIFFWSNLGFDFDVVQRLSSWLIELGDVLWYCENLISSVSSNKFSFVVLFDFLF